MYKTFRERWRLLLGHRLVRPALNLKSTAPIFEKVKMKKAFVILLLPALLSACAMDEFDQMPSEADAREGKAIMADPARALIVKPGTTKKEIQAMLGNPLNQVSTLSGSGVCNNYKRRLDNKDIPLFVSFRNSDDRVVGFQYNTTCEAAKRAGLLNNTKPH